MLNLAEHYLDLLVLNKTNMKKLFVLVALFTTVYVTKANAQDTNTDPAATYETYKNKIKPALMDAASLTDVQAERVIKINYNYYNRMKYFVNLPEEEKKKRVGELVAAEQKEFMAMELSTDKIKIINKFFEDQRKLKTTN